jgi:hypothetical protein
LKPATENFPSIPKKVQPVFIDKEPVIPNKKPTHEDNYSPTQKITQKPPEISTNQISPTTPEKFFLSSVNKKTDQMKTSQSLALTTEQGQKSNKKELILLQKIKLLEEQLKEIQAENDRLRIEKEQEKEKADQLETKLKIAARMLYQ